MYGGSSWWFLVVPRSSSSGLAIVRVGSELASIASLWILAGDAHILSARLRTLPQLWSSSSTNFSVFLSL